MTVDRIIGTFKKCITRLDTHASAMDRKASYHAGIAVDSQLEANRAETISKRLSTMLEV